MCLPYSEDFKLPALSLQLELRGTAEVFCSAQFSTSLYVGNSQKQLLDTGNINAVTYGSNFLPQNIDPTVSGNRPVLVELPPAVHRDGDINYLEFAGIANYNALQVQLIKRFSRRFTYNLSYTWSKAMDLTDGIGGTVKCRPRLPHAELRPCWVRPHAELPDELRVRPAAVQLALEQRVLAESRSTGGRYQALRNLSRGLRRPLTTASTTQPI